jgi:hypothetical protein
MTKGAKVAELTRRAVLVEVLEDIRIAERRTPLPVAELHISMSLLRAVQGANPPTERALRRLPIADDRKCGVPSDLFV